MIEPGRVVARDVGRRFRISTGGGRSLKATILRREPAAIRDFWALRHVDLDIAPGETFGVVGRNGSGKSTLLKLLARIYGPSEGSCDVGGRLSSLLELGAGFHPEFNAIENAFLAGAVYGIPRRELERDLEEIIAFAELEQFAHQPIKTYSSGMFMRLGFSVAMHVKPDVLLLDEVLAVGDERFVQKCLGRIAQYRREGGTILLVTHDPSTVERLCQRALLLEQGQAIMVGDAHDVMTEYHHRLASQGGPDNESAPSMRRAAGFTVETAVVNEAGETHHQFEEGQPFSVSLEITADEDHDNVTVWLVFQDENGRELGGCIHQEFALKTNATTRLSFQASGPPLRNGLFLIDVILVDGNGGSRLFEGKALESLSVYGESASNSGPVRIDGFWSR